MAFDGFAPVGAPEPEQVRPLQAVVATALASVSGLGERLGLIDQRLDSGREDQARASRHSDDPSRAAWVDINEAIASGAEAAAIAVALHHHAAGQLDEIERELAAIAALIPGNAG